LGLLFGLEAGETFFETDGDWEDGVAGCVVLDPFHDFAEMLVLLSDVVLLTQVDQVDDRLGGEEKKRVNEFDLKTLRSVFCLKRYPVQK
jgi:hypothetical protein